MTKSIIDAIKARAAEPIRVDFNRRKLADDLRAARADLAVVLAELERLRLKHEREWA